MITFLPTPDFAESASMLDSRRLGNERVEARMILRWLRDPAGYPRQQGAGYTAMWRGHEDALCRYYNACCDEWARRGYRNEACQPEPVGKRMRPPPWLGDEGLHRTHRSALLCKLPGHYGQFGWADEIPDPKVEYLWPRPAEQGEGEYELAPPKYWKSKATAKETSRSEATQGKKERSVKARPVKAKPVKAKPLKARPVKAKPVKAKPVKAKPVKARPVKAKRATVKGRRKQSDRVATATKADSRESKDRGQRRAARGTRRSPRLASKAYG